MMGTFDIGLAKLATDVGLGLALVFLGMRIKKPSLAPQALGKLKALENSIKNLLGEAEQASVGLTEDLLKRRKELETTLEDVKTAEQKLSRDIVEAEETSKQVIIELREAERALQAARQATSQQQVQRQAQPAYQQPMQQQPVRQQPVMQQPEYDAAYEEDYTTDEAPVEYEPQPRETRQREVQQKQNSRIPPARQQPARRQTPAQAQAYAPRQQQNLMQDQEYGFDQEPPSFTHERENHSGLASRVERSQGRRPVSQAPIQDIERAAENAAQSTHALHAEAIKAALMKRRAQSVADDALQYAEDESTNYVQDALSQMPEVNIRQSAAPVSNTAKQQADERLGVLGGLRRHTQVV